MEPQALKRNFLISHPRKQRWRRPTADSQYRCHQTADPMAVFEGEAVFDDGRKCSQTMLAEVQMFPHASLNLRSLVRLSNK
jgi:hypothetical protein